MLKNSMLAGVCVISVLSGCSDSNESEQDPLSSRNQQPPMLPNIAYWGDVGSIDSAGVNVKARLFLAMRSDSVFWMYLYPQSLPLYHSRSPFDQFRLTGKMQHSSGGFGGSVILKIDSSKSFFQTGEPILQGSVTISDEFGMDGMKYVAMDYLSPNEHTMAKGEFAIRHIDSNFVQMAPVLTP